MLPAEANLAWNSRTVPKNSMKIWGVHSPMNDGRVPVPWKPLRRQSEPEYKRHDHHNESHQPWRGLKPHPQLEAVEAAAAAAAAAAVAMPLGTTWPYLQSYLLGARALKAWPVHPNCLSEEAVSTKGETRKNDHKKRGHRGKKKKSFASNLPPLVLYPTAAAVCSTKGSQLKQPSTWYDMTWHFVNTSSGFQFLIYYYVAILLGCIKRFATPNFLGFWRPCGTY